LKYYNKERDKTSATSSWSVNSLLSSIRNLFNDVNQNNAPPSGSPGARGGLRPVSKRGDRTTHSGSKEMRHPEGRRGLRSGYEQHQEPTLTELQTAKYAAKELLNRIQGDTQTEPALTELQFREQNSKTALNKARDNLQSARTIHGDNHTMYKDELSQYSTAQRDYQVAASHLEAKNAYDKASWKVDLKEKEREFKQQKRAHENSDAATQHKEAMDRLYNATDKYKRLDKEYKEEFGVNDQESVAYASGKGEAWEKLNKARNIAKSEERLARQEAVEAHKYWEKDSPEAKKLQEITTTIKELREKLTPPLPADYWDGYRD
jgi:hypothetical protein